MKRFFWIVGGIVVAVFVYTVLGEEDMSGYADSVQEKIEVQKRFLQHNEQSPFNVFEVEYRDPQYYPIDPDYRVTGTVKKVEQREVMMIRDSDGKDQPYTKHAYISFRLKGQDLKLLILKPTGFGNTNTLFCAFADKTSGDATYGGGRYLDVDIGKSNKVTLDFNLAYNPYCAYAPDYSCPLPPVENILPLAIEAGELDFKSTY